MPNGTNGKHERVRDRIRQVLSTIPVINNRMSPLFLRQITSFEEYCPAMPFLPQSIGDKGFYLLVETENSECRTQPFCLEVAELETFWKQVRAYQNGLINQIPTKFIAGLRNASLLSLGIAIRSEDNFFFKDPYHNPELVFWSNLSKKFLPVVDRHLEGAYIHLGLLWATEHYHWVLDILPRLSIVRRFPELRKMPIILPTGMTSSQREVTQTARDFESAN